MDSNGGVSIPVPDPTERTTEQMLRLLRAERDYVDGKVAVLETRLAGIDRATELLNETVNRVPTDLQKAMGQIRELTDEKFMSVQRQFEERDTRSERESKDNKVAVDAAFAAQKEAASEQNKSNTLAIDKSEKATAETLNKQADLFKSTTDALAAQIFDLKDRLGALQVTVNGIGQNRAGGREATLDSRSVMTIAISVGLLLIGVAGIIVAVLVKKGP